MEEEIKLIVLIVLALCTMWKFKATCQAVQKNSKARKRVTSSQITKQIVNERSEEKTVDKQMTAIDSIIFPPTPRREKPSLKTNSQFYKKSFKVQPNFSQSTVIYNSSFDKNPFNTPVSTLIRRDNSSYLRSIQHLIHQPQTNENSIMCIEQEEEESESKQLIKPLGLLKRKTILKRKKFGKKRKEAKHNMNSLKVSRQVKKRKNMSLIDIDLQIERRQEQLQVLRRLKNSLTNKKHL